jgi:hypothetical protein
VCGVAIEVGLLTDQPTYCSLTKERRASRQSRNANHGPGKPSRAAYKRGFDLRVLGIRSCSSLLRREDAAHSTTVASHALQELRSHSNAFASSRGLRKPRDRTQYCAIIAEGEGSGSVNVGRKQRLWRQSAVCLCRR